MNDYDASKIQELFDKVSPNYDFLNDLLSFGLHRLWKRRLLRWLKPAQGEHWVDLCCGTGDLSLTLANYVCPGGSVLGIDFSSEQLEIAKKKALKKPYFSVSWHKEDVLNNCLPANSFDGVVMAYGLRNLTDPKKGIHEIHRLLKPGARAGILDFNSSIENSLNAWFQKFYLRKFVVPISSIMGLREEYSYLENSLRSFPKGAIQEDFAINAGFADASYKLVAGGQMGALLLTA